MAEQGPEWDPQARSLTLAAGRRDRGITRVVVWAVRGLLVLLTVVLALGSILLADGFDWRTLLPLLIGWPVTSLLARSASAADARTAVRLDERGLHWEGTELPWTEVLGLRRTRRYVRVGQAGPTGARGSALTHGLAVDLTDGRSVGAPERATPGDFGRLVAAAAARDLLPTDVAVTGLLPDDTPPDHVPPQPDELPPD